MDWIFFISFREALQCSLLGAVVFIYPQCRERFGGFMVGVLAAFFLGVGLGWLPDAALSAFRDGSWSFMRRITEAALYFTSLVLITRGQGRPGPLPWAAVLALGFVLFFFEAGCMGFHARWTGPAGGRPYILPGMVFMGAALGLTPLIIMKVLAGKIRPGAALALPGLLISVGALKFAMGGIAEYETGSMLMELRHGIRTFLDGGVNYLHEALLLTGHPYIKTPLAGLSRLVSEKRTAICLMGLLVMAPPALVLIKLLMSPNPAWAYTATGVERRLRTSLSRKELLMQSLPLIGSSIILSILIYAAASSPWQMHKATTLPKGRVVAEGVLTALRDGGLEEENGLRLYARQRGKRETPVWRARAYKEEAMEKTGGEGL